MLSTSGLLQRPAESVYQSNGAFFCTQSVSSLVTRLLAFAAQRRRLQEKSTDSWYAAPAAAAVDRYLLQHPRSAANPLLLLSIDGTDRQTDRQTDGRTLDRFMSLTAYYADRACNSSASTPAVTLCKLFASYLTVT